MGMFYNFIQDEGVELIGCEAAGKGIDTDQHAATIAKGTLGIFHGMKSISARTNTVRSLRFIPSLPALIIPASVPSTLTCTIPDAQPTFR